MEKIIIQDSTAPRLSNIELLRILSILGILTMHAYAQIDTSHSSGVNIMLGYFINATCNIGVSCFVFISGYFGIKTFKRKKLLELIVRTTIYSVIVSLFIYGFDVKSILTAVLTVPLYSLWFLACYMLLMVVAPYVETMITVLSKKQFEALLVVLFITMSVLPTIGIGHNSEPIVSNGGKCFSYFLFLYLVGGYIRLFRDVAYRPSRLLSIHASITLLIVILNWGMGALLHKKIVNFSLDCSPLILASAISVFYFFKSIPFYSTVINVLAKSVLAVYVMNSMYVFFDTKFFMLRECSASNYFFFLLLGEVAVTFVFAIFVDQLVGVIDRTFFK